MTVALEYYDSNTEKYRNFFKTVSTTEIVVAKKDMEHSVIKFYDKNNKKMFESRFEYVGFYQEFSKSWLWAWADPQLLKNNSYLSRKLLYYGLDLDPQIDDVFLKNTLLKSDSPITDIVQLETNTAIASYLTKIPLIYTDHRYSVGKHGVKKYTYDVYFLLDYKNLKL